MNNSYQLQNQMQIQSKKQNSRSFSILFWSVLKWEAEAHFKVSLINIGYTTHNQIRTFESATSVMEKVNEEIHQTDLICSYNNMTHKLCKTLNLVISFLKWHSRSKVRQNKCVMCNLKADSPYKEYNFT